VSKSWGLPNFDYLKCQGSAFKSLDRKVLSKKKIHLILVFTVDTSLGSCKYSSLKTSIDVRTVTCFFNK